MRRVGGKRPLGIFRDHQPEISTHHTYPGRVFAHGPDFLQVHFVHCLVGWTDVAVTIFGGAPCGALAEPSNPDWRIWPLCWHRRELGAVEMEMFPVESNGFALPERPD